MKPQCPFYSTNLCKETLRERKALKVPAEAIKNFDEEAAINIVSTTFNDNSSVNSNCTVNINPIEKWLDALEENKKLYERLLQTEKEKVALLEKMLDLKK